MLSYPATIPLSSRTLNHLADRIRQHRNERRSRWRRLTPGRQALLALAHLRNGDTYTRLAAGFEVGVATAWRYVQEAIALLTAGVLLIRQSNQRTWQQELVAYVLPFPRGLDPAAVVAFIAGLGGLVAPRLERPFVVRAVAFETSATAAGIQHHLIVPRPLAHVVLSALRAALPGVSVRPDEDYHVEPSVLAAELGLNNHGRTLATDQAAISSAILASLFPLEAGEQLLVQWSLAPLGPVPMASAEAGQPVIVGVWDVLRGQTSTRPVDAEVLKAARIKQQAPLFAAIARVGVVANPLRARSLLLRVLAAFHTANAPGVHLYRLSRSSKRVGRAVAERRLPRPPSSLAWASTVVAYVDVEGCVAVAHQYGHRAGDRHRLEQT